MHQRPPWGLTAAEYAVLHGLSTSTGRAAYRRLIREGPWPELPAPRRILEEDGAIKFTLPALTAGPDAAAPPKSAIHGTGGRAGASVLGSDRMSQNAEGTAWPPAAECETVIIPMDGHHGNRWKTLCVSTQVGCAMGCVFCETGGMGLVANLRAEEITGQRLAARRLLGEGGGRRAEEVAWNERKDEMPLSPPFFHPPPSAPHPSFSALRPPPSAYFSDGIRNIVFMGMGEALDNYDEVVRAIRVLNDPAGFDFPLSQMTLSTAGHVEGLRRLAKEGLKNLRLSISLNAATDSLRDALMPMNRIWPLAEIQRTLLEIPLPRKGRFLVGYVLLKDVNDSLADADAVAAWCRPFAATVNLIPYNSQRTARFTAPEMDRVLAFMRRLKEKGCFVKRRVSRGQSLMAACGQLGGASVA
jgi:23S rRNA (adenine2503-C2)-methyltransferase